MKITRVAIAAALLTITNAAAQASGFGVEANGARSYGVWGGELGLGYHIGTYRVRCAT